MKAFTEALLCGNLQRASHVFRYSSRPVISRETVAEHSFYVALYALMISERLIGYTISTSMLLSRAISHDLDESLTGDFQRQFKYSSPSLRAEIGKASEQFMHTLLLPFPPVVAHPIFIAWKSAKDDDIEGDIIKVADLLAVVSYIIKEVRMGNRHLMNIVDECLFYGREIQIGIDGRNELCEIVTEALILLEGLEHGN